MDTGYLYLPFLSFAVQPLFFLLSARFGSKFSWGPFPGPDPPTWVDLILFQ